MHYLRNWRGFIPRREQLYYLLPMAMIVIMMLGYLLFVMLSIVPQTRVMREKAYQLSSARRKLIEAEATQREVPNRLREQVAAAEVNLRETAKVFLSEPQAAEALGKLYQYADESGVKIIALQIQSGSQEVKKGVYDVKTFQLRAEGSLPALMDFISRIEEARFLKTFILTDINITEGEDLHILTMNITLYTSPYSSKKPTVGLLRLVVTPTLRYACCSHASLCFRHPCTRVKPSRWAECSIGDMKLGSAYAMVLYSISDRWGGA